MTGQYSRSADKIDIRYVAHLARLHLTDEEVDRFQGQLEQVLGYVHELDKLDVEGVEPTAHAMPVNNVFRKDEMKLCMNREKVFANAPLERRGQFVVPKIVE
jgi:aspartyl-tRNA(Asn)/glutamyl-tRNA(Gln) amidotransferase subunit C